MGAGGLHGVSCGLDRALRLFTRTEEPLVLNDTDEAEEGLATGDDKVRNYSLTESVIKLVIYRHTGCSKMCNQFDKPNTLLRYGKCSTCSRSIVKSYKF